MTIEAQYAQALHQLVEANPNKAAEYLAGLKGTLGAKGHTKLAPRIFTEYERIVERQGRSTGYKHTTPEAEQTRTLLELYRTLVKS